MTLVTFDNDGDETLVTGAGEACDTLVTRTAIPLFFLSRGVQTRATISPP